MISKLERPKKLPCPTCGPRKNESQSVYLAQDGQRYLQKCHSCQAVFTFDDYGGFVKPNKKIPLENNYDKVKKLFYPPKKEKKETTDKEVFIVNFYKPIRENNIIKNSIECYGSEIITPWRTAASNVKYMKMALKGSKKRGSCYIFPAKDTNKYALCEGYATADTIHALSDYIGVCCFGKENLEHIFKKMKGLFLGESTPKIRIFPDNAVKLSDELESAGVVLHIPLLPDFKKGYDWNDIFIKKGEDFVKDLLRKITIKQQSDSAIRIDSTYKDTYDVKNGSLNYKEDEKMSILKSLSKAKEEYTEPLNIFSKYDEPREVCRQLYNVCDKAKKEVATKKHITDKTYKEMKEVEKILHKATPLLQSGDKGKDSFMVKDGIGLLFSAEGGEQGMVPVFDQSYHHEMYYITIVEGLTSKYNTERQGLSHSANKQVVIVIISDKKSFPKCCHVTILDRDSVAAAKSPAMLNLVSEIISSSDPLNKARLVQSGILAIKKAQMRNCAEIYLNQWGVSNDSYIFAQKTFPGKPLWIVTNLPETLPIFEKGSLDSIVAERKFRGIIPEVVKKLLITSTAAQFVFSLLAYPFYKKLETNGETGVVNFGVVGHLFGDKKTGKTTIAETLYHIFGGRKMDNNISPQVLDRHLSDYGAILLDELFASSAKETKVQSDWESLIYRVSTGKTRTRLVPCAGGHVSKGGDPFIGTTLTTGEVSITNENTHDGAKARVIQMTQGYDGRGRRIGFIPSATARKLIDVRENSVFGCCFANLIDAVKTFYDTRDKKGEKNIIDWSKSNDSGDKHQHTIANEIFKVGEGVLRTLGIKAKFCNKQFMEMIPMPSSYSSIDGEWTKNLILKAAFDILANQRFYPSYDCRDSVRNSRTDLAKEIMDDLGAPCTHENDLRRDIGRNKALSIMEKGQVVQISDKEVWIVAGVLKQVITKNNNGRKINSVSYKKYLSEAVDLGFISERFADEGGAPRRLFYEGGRTVRVLIFTPKILQLDED